MGTQNSAVTSCPSPGSKKQPHLDAHSGRKQMVDNLSPEQRRRTMQSIRSRNTQPELKVRQFLHRLGFRFRLHDSNLPGKPDIILPRYKTAIFVHGCFWHTHGCSRSVIPKTRRSYWVPKLAANVARDRIHTTELAHAGWRTITVWECESTPLKLRRRLRPLLRRTLKFRNLDGG